MASQHSLQVWRRSEATVPHSEVKKFGKKVKSSPKKGKKQHQQTGENKEDLLTLIFGENGEKVTEKGTPKSKLLKADESKTEEEMGPEGPQVKVGI